MFEEEPKPELTSNFSFASFSFISNSPTEKKSIESLLGCEFESLSRELTILPFLFIELTFPSFDLAS